MKKALHIAGRVVTALILVFAVTVMIFTIISVSTVGRDKSSLFGYKPNIVLSDSMQDTFAVGDLEISKEVDPQTLKAGDIITFISIDPANYGAVVTHKIREITVYNGEPAFITYGTTTGVDDAYPVPFENVIGKYLFRLPKMGYFFEFLRTPAGYITVILIPFLLLILTQAIRFFRLVGQYRAERRAEAEAKQAEFEAQKAEIEAQRNETVKLKAELEYLRGRMSENATRESARSAQSDNASGESGQNDL